MGIIGRTAWVAVDYSREFISEDKPKNINENVDS